MFTGARNIFSLTCLLLAVIGPVQLIATLTIPAQLAIADEIIPQPQVLHTSWLAIIDLVVKVLAVIAAWLARPKAKND